MKITLFLLSLFIVLNISCNSQDKKIYIKSIKSPSEKRIDWYFYSLISNFSRSYLQFEGKEDNPFFESFYLSDIFMQEDTLYIKVYKNDYKLDSLFISKYKLNVVIDTTGKIWNQASSRLGRLQRKGVDFFKPHFTNTYCPNGECY